MRAPKRAGFLPSIEWNPPFCGDIDMEIRADGTWFYIGTPIGRAPLVRLFSTVLRRDEDGKTYLVTPVEKVGIRVADAPFVAVEMNAGERDGEPLLTFRTNVGDVVEAGAEHSLRFVIHGENSAVEALIFTCAGGWRRWFLAPLCTNSSNAARRLEVDGDDDVLPALRRRDVSGHGGGRTG